MKKTVPKKVWKGTVSVTSSSLVLTFERQTGNVRVVETDEQAGHLLEEQTGEVMIPKNTERTRCSGVLRQCTQHSFQECCGSALLL